MNAGLFGGTFDPPHMGHLIVAQDAALALGLDRILFVPAAIPPHKQAVALTPAPLRARMLELALGADARFAMTRIELERSGTSYTVDTLAALRQDDASTEWTLLIGADQYNEFETWRDPAAIRRLARVAVLTREGGHDSSARLIMPKPADTAGAGARRSADTAVTGGTPSAESAPDVTPLGNGDVRVAVTRIDISSTAIRRRVAAGMSIRYLVPPAVEQFIFEQRLYLRNGPLVTG